MSQSPTGRYLRLVECGRGCSVVRKSSFTVIMAHVCSAERQPWPTKMSCCLLTISNSFSALFAVKASGVEAKYDRRMVAILGCAGGGGSRPTAGSAVRSHRGALRVAPELGKAGDDAAAHARFRRAPCRVAMLLIGASAPPHRAGGSRVGGRQSASLHAWAHTTSPSGTTIRQNAQWRACVGSPACGRFHVQLRNTSMLAAVRDTDHHPRSSGSGVGPKPAPLFTARSPR